MNIVIINGNPDKEDSAFDRYMQGYQLKLHNTGHYVKSFQLRDMRIAGPGKPDDPDAPVQTGFPLDDVKYILNILKETDLLVWACPLRQGLMPELARMVQSRVNRFIQDNQSAPGVQWTVTEIRHGIPLIGVILQPESDTSYQEILLNRLTQERMAANLNTVVSFMITTELTVTDAACETFRSFDYRLYIENTCNDFLTNKVSAI
jgi:hypothetical protein